MGGIITLINGKTATVDGKISYFQFDEKHQGIRVYSDNGKKEIFYPYTAIISVEVNYKPEPDIKVVDID